MRLKSLGHLFEQYKDRLYLAALAITKNQMMAEDAVHDGLLAVAQTPSEIKDLKAYLFTSVKNKARHSLQKQHKSEETWQDFFETAEFNADTQMFANQIMQHIQTLNPDQQEIFILKTFADLSFKEIAEMMGSPLNTVASIYRRTKLALKEKFHE